MADTELNNLVNELQRIKIQITKAKKERLQLTQADIFTPRSRNKERLKLTKADIFTPRSRNKKGEFIKEDNRLRISGEDILINKHTFPDLEEAKFRMRGKIKSISSSERREMRNGVLLIGDEIDIFDELSAKPEIRLQKSLVGRGDIRDKRILPRSSLQKALNVELTELRTMRLKSRDRLRNESFNFGVRSLSAKSLSKTFLL